MVEGFAAHWLGRGESHDEAVATRTLTQLWVRGLGMPARVPPRTAARPIRPVPAPAPAPAPASRKEPR